GWGVRVGKVSRAGTSRKSSGNSGGEKERRIRSRRLDTGERGPLISIVTRSSQSGAKKRRPSRGARWRGVRNRWMRLVPRSSRSRPSARMPVPASRIPAVSLFVITSTQEVLPPYVAACAPGAGIDPRHPQTFRRTTSRPLAAPEDRDDADELLGVREQRKRAHLDLA